MKSDFIPELRFHSYTRPTAIKPISGVPTSFPIQLSHPSSSSLNFQLSLGFFSLLWHWFHIQFHIKVNTAYLPPHTSFNKLAFPASFIWNSDSIYDIKEDFIPVFLNAMPVPTFWAIYFAEYINAGEGKEKGNTGNFWRDESLGNRSALKWNWRWW